MSDQPDTRTEDAVRRALGARADDVPVSPDALDRIRSRPRSRGVAVRSLALAGVAAVAALLVGIAVVTQSDDESDGQLDVAGTTTSTSATPTSTTEPTNTEAPPPDDPDPGARLMHPSIAASEGRYLWPLDERTFESPLEATRSWLMEVVGVGEPDLEEVDAVFAEGFPEAELFALFKRGENGERLDATTWISAAWLESRDSFVVVEAFPDPDEEATLHVDLVERNGWSEGSLRVTGGGEAFEGTALLFVDDAEPVIVSVGAFGPGRFSVVVPWDGSGPVTLRLQATDPIEGAVPDVVASVTEPLPASTDLRVMRVALDDVLNMRAAPGVDNDVVFALDPYAGALTHTGRTEFVDGEEWWEIVTTPPESVVGWANARYLSVQPDIAAGSPLADEMIAEARRLLSSFADPDSTERPAEHPRGVEVGGIGVFADAPTPFTPVSDLWSDTTHDWAPFDSCVEVCVRTVSGFLEVTARDVDDATYVIGLDVARAEPNFSYLTGLDPDQAGILATVTAYVEPSNDGEADWKRYILTFDFVDGSPTIASIWRWGWTP